MNQQSSYQKFHEDSRMEGRHMVTETSVNPATWPKEWTEITTKTYPRLPHIPLPTEDLPVHMSLIDSLHKRASLRDKSNVSIGLAEVATILRNAFSFRKPDGEIYHQARRVYPSAGARFPLECYLIANRVDGLPSGLYHYELREDRLAQLLVGNLEEEVRGIFGEYLAEASAVMVLTAQMERTTIKYGERGYRFALMEVGHVMQNVCLISTALGIAQTPIGGFADEMMARLLDLDDTDEIVLYTCVFP